MREQAIARTLPPDNPIAALFNLDDEDERFIVGTMQRFHEDGFTITSAIRRTSSQKGERVIVELACFRRRATQWQVIYWNPDERSVRFRPCQSHQEARAVYNAEPLPSLDGLRGVKMPNPKHEPQSSKPPPAASYPMKPVENFTMPEAEFDRIMGQALQVKPERKDKTPESPPQKAKK